MNPTNYSHPAQNKMISTKLQLLVLLAVACGLTLAEQAAEETLELDKLLVESGVIPEVIQSPAQNELYVYYKKTEVEPGKKLSVAQVKLQFSSTLVRVDSSNSKQDGTFDNTLFTLALVDPDAPNGRQTKPDFLEHLHYLTINIPCRNFTSGSDTFVSFDFNKGNVLVSYESPNPSPKTGDHRYVFVLYKQNVKIDNAPGGDKNQFNLSKWIGQQKLNYTDIPFAANFFLVSSSS